MKKRVVSVLLAGVMIVGTMLTGCGSAGQKETETAAAQAEQESAKPAAETDGEEAQPEEQNASAEKIVINLYEHSDAESYVTDLVEAFEKENENVDVNVTFVANDDYDDKVKVMLAGGGDVDVFWLRDAGQVQTLAAEGALMPLDDLCSANEVDPSVLGDFQSGFSYDGQTYGLSTTKTMYMLFYNKALFDEAGLPYPEAMTWDEYGELAKSLTKDGKVGSMMMNWSYTYGSDARGEYITDDNLDTVRRWVEYLYQWYVTDHSHYNLEEMSTSFDPYGKFAEGNTYMMIQGNWTYDLLKAADPDLDFSSAPLPVFEGDENVTCGGTSAYVINSKCGEEKIQAAFDLMKFMCYSDEGAMIYVENNQLPAYPSEEAKEAYMELNTIDGTEYLFEANVRMEGDGTKLYYNEVKSAFQQEMELALLDTCSIDEAFDNFLQRRDEIIATYE